MTRCLKPQAANNVGSKLQMVACEQAQRRKTDSYCAHAQMKSPCTPSRVSYLLSSTTSSCLSNSQTTLFNRFKMDLKVSSLLLAAGTTRTRASNAIFSNSTRSCQSIDRQLMLVDMPAAEAAAVTSVAAPSTRCRTNSVKSILLSKTVPVL